MSAQAKSINKKVLHGSFLEQAGELASETVKTTVSEAGKVASGVVRQIIGSPASENAANRESTSPENYPRRVGLERPQVIREFSVFSFEAHRERVEAQREITQLIAEIKREITILQSRQKVLISETAKVIVEALPENPGVYHVNFLEWILKMLRDLKKQVTESSSWLSVLKSRRQQKGYWRMLKKHGTQWGMSSERGLATSAG